MPHYVVKPTKTSLKYYIFSTIVMNAVTPKMYRKEMEAWLMSHEGYEGFCDPRPADEQFPEYYGEKENRPEYLKRDLELTYWNGSFWYVTEEDNYFV